VRIDHGKHKVPFSLKGVPLVNRFVARDVEMLQLEDNFHPKTPSPTRRKVFVIYGLGGIGKTQLAIEFARKHHSRFSAVFWLDGSSKDRLKQAFVDIAGRLPQDEITADAAEALKHSNSDINVVVGGVLRWLSLSSNQRWLLIIDNMDRDHLNPRKDPQAYNVEDFFPSADHGSILITTRLAGLFRTGHSWKLDKVDDEQAKTILENNAGKLIKSK
jgi:AAA ATPase domain